MKKTTVVWLQSLLRSLLLEFFPLKSEVIICIIGYLLDYLFILMILHKILIPQGTLNFRKDQLSHKLTRAVLLTTKKNHKKNTKKMCLKEFKVFKQNWLLLTTWSTHGSFG